ncbi:MAG: hypothetical protein ACREGC_00320, partial [Minisyncoccia bacterium]
PQVCQDPTAINYHGALPCQYPAQVCQDPSAINYHGALPCQYPAQVCQDPSAINYHGALPCQYQQNPTVTLSADNSNISSGNSTTLRWSSQNATSCSTSGGTNGWSSNGRGTTGTFNTGSLNNDETYNITCTNNTGASAFDSVTVFVNGNGGNVSVSIYADDDNISSGDSTRIHWDSNNADYCNRTGGSNGWSRSNQGTSGSFNTGDLTNDTTYRITCYNNNGDSDNDSVTVNVNDNNNNNRPTVNIYANPSSVDYGSSSIVTWNSSNADSCYASGGTNGWSGNRGTNGSFNTGSLYNSTTFSISCSNNQGSVSDSTTVFVGNNQPINIQPTVSIYADSTNLPYGGTTFLRWSSANATSCYASGGSAGWAGAKSIGPASFFTGSLFGSTTYSITCSNNTGSANNSVIVGVRGQVLGTSTYVPTPSLVLVTSSVDRNQPIVPTLDNTNPCPGDEINYMVTYQNVGASSVTNLTLRVDLPLEVDYLSSNPNNPLISGNSLLFNLGTLKAGGQGTVTVRARVRNNIPAGTPLNFPAVLSYVTAGVPQSVTASVSANVCGIINANLGANVFWTSFLPNNIFGWLLLLILILLLVLLAKYLFVGPTQVSRREVTTTTTATH